MQFIEVLRSLAEKENKQVVLLSHRDQWIEQGSSGVAQLMASAIE